MCVFLGGEDAEDVVVFVDGLAVVSSLLLVPPIRIRIALGALDWYRIFVAAILFIAVSGRNAERVALQLTMFGSSMSA